MKNRALLFILAMVLSIGASFAQNATKSVVYLKNGTAVTGVIMEMQNDTIKLESSNGSTSVIPMSEVDRIANVSALGESQSESASDNVAKYQIRRVGRDLYIGRSTLYFEDVYTLFGKEAYKSYRSAYTLAGTGAFFLTTGIIAGGLGAFWIIRGKTDVVVQTGRICCGVACVALPIGITLRIIGKCKIGRIVKRYNSGQLSADAFEFAPSLLEYNDIISGGQSYALGATLKISF